MKEQKTNTLYSIHNQIYKHTLEMEYKAIVHNTI